MSWESYVEHYAPAFFRILEALSAFASFILLPIREWIFDIVDHGVLIYLFDLIGDFSLVELVIGGGLITFLTVTVVKWIIGIVT